MKRGGFYGFFLAALLVAACSFEIPEKVHVTGNPKYVANLGEDSVDTIYLKDYFGIEDINEIFNESGDEGFKVYKYAYRTDAMTYLLHYKPEPIELSLDTDDFKFNPGDDGVTIVSVTVPALMFSYESPIAVPSGSSAFPALGGSLISSATATFTEAIIEEGSISLSVGGDSYPNIFSNVQIELKKGAVSQGKISPSPDGTYSLAGKKLEPGTEIYFSGSINNTTGNAINGQLKAAINVTKFESITINPNDSSVGNAMYSQAFPIDLSEIKKWVKSITFEEIGVRIKAGPGTTRIDGAIKLTITEGSLLDIDLDLPGPSYIKEIDLSDIYEPNGAEVVFSGKLGDLTAASPDTSITVGPEFAGYLTVYNVTPGVPVDIELAPQPIFEWSEAVVYPNAIATESGVPLSQQFPDVTNGEDPIDLSEIFESLKDAIGSDADKIRLTEAKVYLYIDASGDLLTKSDTKFKLTAFYNSNSYDLTGGSGGFVSADPDKHAPEFTEGSAEYAEELQEQYTPISIAGIINSQPSDFSLTAEVQLPAEATVTPVKGQGGTRSVSIAPQIVIELPLSLQVTRDTTNDPANIAVLDLNMLVYEDANGNDKIDTSPNNEKEDLLDRNGPDDQEEFFEYLEDVKLSIQYDNRFIKGDATLMLYIPETDQSFDFTIGPGEGSAVFDLSMVPVKFPPPYEEAQRGVNYR